MTPAYSQNPYRPHALRDHPPQRRKERQTVILGTDGLPIGTAAQVLAWVEDDPERAEQCLVKEQAEPRPRVSLVANLKAVLKRNGVEAPGAERELPPGSPEAKAAPDGSVEDVDPLALVRERLQVDS